MALTAFNPRSFDLSDTYAFTGTVSGTNVGGGSLVKISEQTASASSSISFTSGIDSTYRTYCFKFINIHPANNDVTFQFNGSSDGGSNYNVTKTTTFFQAYHLENDGGTGLSYQASSDLSQSTSPQHIMRNINNTDADMSGSGELWLFNPSSTTYVKHFIGMTNYYHIGSATAVGYFAGYFNTTSAINGIQFTANSGDIDDGTITMYGIA
jgi:hypothetical protein